MPFDIKNLNPAEWFEYPGTKERVCLQLPDDEKNKEIEAATSKKMVEHVHPTKRSGKPDRRRPLQRIEYNDVDTDLEEEMYIDAVIVDWEIKTPEGKPIPLNKTNKLLMMKGSIEFNQFVNGKLEIMAEQKTERDEVQEKN